MSEPAPGGVEESLPEFSDPYTDLAVEGAARADTLSLVLIGCFAVILLIGMVSLYLRAR